MLKLVPLPRKPNVHDILAAYRQHYMTVKREGKAGRPPAVLDEILDGLALYFNKSLGNNLLYRFERAQYTQMRKEMTSSPKSNASDEQELDAAKVYGAEHLLRLFGKLFVSVQYINILLTLFLHFTSQSAIHCCAHDNGPGSFDAASRTPYRISQVGLSCQVLSSLAVTHCHLCPQLSDQGTEKVLRCRIRGRQPSLSSALVKLKT